MNEILTYKKILKFWLPLSMTWLMMSFEGPFLTAIIARMKEQEFNLAAYGVSFTIALIIESPVIMLLSASTALIENRQTFYKLRSFVMWINVLITVAMLILIIPPVFHFFAIDLVQLPKQVADLTYYACILLIPWAPAIGYRRFYQGILIRNNLTKYVAYGTVIRISGMILTALTIYIFFPTTHGVYVGAAALSAGVIVEAIAARIMVEPVLPTVINAEVNAEKHLSYSEIFHFYYPLALTSFISLGFQPVVTFFMAKSNRSLESLAVLPVINSLVFLWRSLGLSIPEVVIALLKDTNDYKRLKIFSTHLGWIVFLSLGVVTFTPIANIWLIHVSGLSEKLASFSQLSLILYTLFPLLTVWINFQRAVLINRRNTRPLTMGIIVEVLGMFIVLLVCVSWLGMIGVLAAVLAMTIGRLTSNLYLILPYKKAVLKINGLHS